MDVPGYIIALIAFAALRSARVAVRKGYAWKQAIAGFAVLMLSLHIFSIWIVPQGDINPALKNALEENALPGRQIVFFGSSQTYRNLDPDLLQRELGYGAVVSVIAADGMGVLEQQHYLSIFLHHAKKPPAAVIFEASSEYDTKPARAFVQYQQTRRGLLSSDLDNLVWLLRASKADVTSGILGNFLLHLLQAGLWRDAVFLSDVEAKEAYAPFTDTSGMTDFPKLMRTDPISEAQIEWLKQFRHHQRNILEERGINIAVFAPPDQGDGSTYARNVCTLVAHTPCISPTDELLLALNKPKLWHDSAHLNVNGVRIYTKWVAEQLKSQPIISFGQRLRTSSSPSK